MIFELEVEDVFLPLYFDVVVVEGYPGFRKAMVGVVLSRCESRGWDVQVLVVSQLMGQVQVSCRVENSKVI